MGDREVSRLARRFYAEKARVYRKTLVDLANRYGERRRRALLSPQIRSALEAEADDHARKVVDTYNRDLSRFASRYADEPIGIFAQRITFWASDRAKHKAGVIARTEAATPKLDATVGFFRENGHDLGFEFAGPPAQCPTCKALKETSPHSGERAVAVGLPHINCRHHWRPRFPARSKLLGGDRPGVISLGRGQTAGIIGKPSYVQEAGGTEEAAALISEAG